MTKLLEQFEIDCRRTGKSPAQIFTEAGVHRSIWYRWRNGRAVKLASYEQARDRLDELLSQ